MTPSQAWGPWLLADAVSMVIALRFRQCWRGRDLREVGLRGGSWVAPTPYGARVGTMNRSEMCHRYGVPPSGGPDRLKPGLQTGGSWKAPTTLMPCIGTMNPAGSCHRYGVPPSGGPDRLKPGLRAVGSWRASFRFCA